MLDHLVTRLHRLLRAGRRRTVVVILLMVAAAGTTGRALEDAADTQRIYGDRRRIEVASRDLDLGHIIGEDDLERRELPAALIPDAPVDDPIGRTVIEPIVAGEVLLPRRLSDQRSSGMPAVIGDTARVVSIERTPLTPGVRPGDHVDLCAPGVGARGAVIARRALVIGADEDSVTVAITTAELPAVARSILDGDVIMALIGER